MTQVQNKVESNEQEIVQILEASQQNRKIISEHFQVYQQKMEHFQQSRQSIKLKMQEINYNENYHKFYYKVIDSFSESEIVCIEVAIGSFTLPLKILNVASNSLLSKKNAQYEGGFGQIYFLSFLKREFVVKTVKYSLSAEEERRDSLNRIIKEYCITKICSKLGCGPQVLAPFGFDLILYLNCAQFCVEKCDRLLQMDQKVERQLYVSLTEMHNYGIVHLDINPDNIMFSPTTKKTVFIDFGLSKVIAEQRGFKTSTTFRGTPEFVSKQMLQLIVIEGSVGYIDLYYNDLVGLEKTIKEVKKLHKTKKKIINKRIFDNQNQQISAALKQLANGELIKENKKQLTIEDSYLLILLKFYCYFQRKQVQSYLNQHRQVLIQKYGWLSLLFFKNFLPSIFFENLVMNEFQAFSKFSIFQQFLEQMRKGGQIPRLRFPNKEDRFHNTSSDLRQKFESKWFQHDQLSQNKKIDMVAQLKSKDFYESCEDKTVYYSLIFQLIRFDKKNLILEVKKQLAEAFICFLQKTEINEGSNPFTALRCAFKDLLSYCLSEPFTQWKQYHRCLLMIQANLTQTDIRDQLMSIYKLIMLDITSLERKIELIWQILLLYYLYDAQQKFQDEALAIYTQNQIDEMMSFSVGHCISKYCHTQDVQERMMIQILKEFRIYSQEQCFKKKAPFQANSLFQLNNCIRNQKVRNILKKMYLNLQFQDNQQCYQNSNAYNERKNMEPIRRLFEEHPELRSQNFAERIAFLGVKIKLHSSEKAKISQYQTIREDINCDTIFHRFRIKYLLPVKKEQVRKYAYDLMESCFKKKKRVVSGLYTFIEMGRFYNEQNSDLKKVVAQNMIKFYAQYLEDFKQDNEIETLWKGELKLQQIERIFKKMQEQRVYFQEMFQIIKAFFHRFSRDSEQYSDFVRLVRLKHWKFLQYYLKDDILHVERNHVLMHYHYLLYQFQSEKSDIQAQNYCFLLFLHLKRYLQLSSQANQIKSSVIPISSILFIISRNDARLSFQQFKKYTEKLLIWSWKFLKINNSIEMYLNERGPYFFGIFDTLNILWRNKNQYGSKVYQFLKDIIEFISLQPLSTKIAIFFDNIVKMIPSNIQLFRHETLRSHIGYISWKNRYCCILYAFTIKYNLYNSQQQQIKLIWDITKHLWTLQFMCRSRLFGILLYYMLGSLKQRRRVYLVLRYFLKHYYQIQRSSKGRQLVFLLKHFQLRKQQKNVLKQALKIKIFNYCTKMEMKTQDIKSQ